MPLNVSDIIYVFKSIQPNLDVNFPVPGVASKEKVTCLRCNLLSRGRRYFYLYKKKTLLRTDL